MKGHEVTVFNRDRSKAEKLVATGTKKLTVANQPKKVGDSSDIAIICVKDYQAVANISFVTGGLIETTNRELIVIQCSTISPDESNKLAHLYSEKQIRMLSVPILGGTTAVQRRIRGGIPESEARIRSRNQSEEHDTCVRVKSAQWFRLLILSKER